MRTSRLFLAGMLFAGTGILMSEGRPWSLLGAAVLGLTLVMLADEWKRSRRFRGMD